MKMFAEGDVIKVTPVMINEKGQGILVIGNFIIVIDNMRIGETGWVKIKRIRKTDSRFIVEAEKLT